MARGWDSKSVESQIDSAGDNRNNAPRRHQTPEQLEQIRRRESLLLSCKRVSHDLENARNPRYRVVLEKALADLNAQIAAIK